MTDKLAGEESGWAYGRTGKDWPKWEEVQRYVKEFGGQVVGNKISFPTGAGKAQFDAWYAENAPAGVRVRSVVTRVHAAQDKAHHIWGWLKSQANAAGKLHNEVERKVFAEAANASLAIIEDRAAPVPEAKAEQVDDTDIAGPLTDAQRQHAQHLYRNLHHLGPDAMADVVRYASVCGYTNGRRDFAAPVVKHADLQKMIDDEPSMQAKVALMDVMGEVKNDARETDELAAAHTASDASRIKAWHEVCRVLEELDPECFKRGGTGLENAVFAIRKLAGRDINEAAARTAFESLASDSYGFKRSRRGTYINPTTARDWKWFRLGATFAKPRAEQQVWNAENVTNACVKAGLGVLEANSLIVALKTSFTTNGE